jgi:CheY-like chemotaxis protein
MLLHQEGHDVNVAHSAQVGLDIARDFYPQVILCDIGLPVVDGYQVIRMIRQDETLSSTYVIALTGYGREKDQRRALDAGFNLHLTKPMDYNDLRQAIAGIGTEGGHCSP